MQIDVRQLQYFVAVAEDLNFTRAAQRLNVVQQSLSSAIARLEAQLGFALFERSSREVTVTDRGTQWLPYAREVLVAADRAQRAARDLAAGRAGTLRVGDVLEAARDGRAVGLVPASIAHSQNWPGLAFVEVADIPESEIAVAWRSASQSALVAEFVALAEELGDSRSALSTTA